MTPEKIMKLLDAKLICGEQNMDRKIKYAFAADLMSDVLTINTEEMLLVTGMANPQVIRTAEMSEIPFVLFVRGKKVTEEMTELAIENGITLLQSNWSMFKVCGELYKAGLQPVY